MTVDAGMERLGFMAAHYGTAGTPPVQPRMNDAHRSRVRSERRQENPALRESTMPLTGRAMTGTPAGYDSWNKPHGERNASDVLELLGPGMGCA